MKKSLALLIVLTILTSTIFTGCGKQSESKKTLADTEKAKTTEKISPEKSTDEKEPVTIRIAWWGSQSRHDYTLELLDMYTELNPNITFEPEYTGWDEYWQKLSYQSAANGLPDIMQTVVGRPETNPLARNGLFADLAPFVGNELDLSQVSDSLISTGEVDGTLYGASLSSNALAVIYDPAILESAGVDIPEFGYTWDDFEAMCQQINDKLGIYGTGDIETQNILYNYYPRQFDEHFFAQEGSDLGISDEVFQNYIAMKLDLQTKGLMPTPSEITQAKGIEDLPIVHGKAAFSWKWAPNLGTLESAAGRTLGLLPLPGPNAEKAQYVKAGMHFSVAKSSAVKKEAAKFMNWFINDVEANKVINADRGVPASAAVRTAMKPNLGEAQQKIFDFVDFVGNNSAPQDLPAPEGANEVIQIVKDLEGRVLFEVITPEEATESFRKDAPTKLK